MDLKFSHGSRTEDSSIQPTSTREDGYEEQGETPDGRSSHVGEETQRAEQETQ